MKKIIFLSLLVFPGLFSCTSNEPGVLEDVLKGSMNVRLNPSGRVPLGGLLTFRTEEPCKVAIEVEGTIPMYKEFETLNTSHSIPVLGLYGGSANKVNIKLTNEKGREFNGQIVLETSAIPEIFPDIKINTKNEAKMEPGFPLAELLIANNGKFHAYTIMFDLNGDIRWFMDMSEVGQIAYSPLRLSNGNWLYLSWIDLWELDDLGQEISKEQMWNYAGNHAIIELPNNRLMLGGSKKDAKVIRKEGAFDSRYDYLVEWDRTKNMGVKDWDLGALLDIDRSVFPADFSLDNKRDWFHLNSIAESKTDNSWIVSGRNQGVLKVDSENNLKWILAPHKDWGKSGRDGTGFNTNEYLLTAIDSEGKPYNDAIQGGIAGAEDFEWSTGQHALSVLDNGNLLLFDNGLSRNFDPKPQYSRAVEYKVNEEDMTIQQVWEFGSDLGLDMYSPVTSDVEVLPQTKNRLVTAGTIRKGKDAPHSRMFEITYPENEVVFDAQLFFKDANGTGEASWAQFDLVFSGARVSLYSK